MRAGSIVLVALLGLAGVVFEHRVVVGGIAWFGFLFFVMSGWGYLVVRTTRVPDPDFGLRAAWGIAGFLAISGVLLALGLCNARALEGLIAIGFAGFAWREWTTERSLLACCASVFHSVRADPKRLFACAIVGLALFELVAGVCKLRGNVWDDDVAYTSFLRRLLDIGNMNEPFSFRRLGAYGGQVVLNATAAVRGNMQNIYLVDHGLCQGLMFLLVHGYARSKKLAGIYQALLVLVLLLLPSTSINTASHYSGVVGFVALYRTVVLVGETGHGLERRYLAIAALLGAGICTLRQNYIPVVMFFVGFVLIARLWKLVRIDGLRRAWTAERALWLILVAVSGVVILPYCVAAYTSNGSFLFPLMRGTWNHGLQLTPYVWSWSQELEFFKQCLLEPHGIVVIAPLCCVVLFVKDERSGRPLGALFAASTLAFLLLVHSLTSSDPLNLWRYAFGYVATLTIVLAIELAPSRQRPPAIAHGRVARWVVVGALLLQVVGTCDELWARCRAMRRDVHAARVADHHPDRHEKVVQRYRELQQAIPAGARVMTMLDYAGHLDFKRNDLLLIDTPGWCAWDRYPAFEGPTAVKAYFLAHGIRYVAFVRPEKSVALYRRDGWLRRLYTDREIFRIMAAYLVDTIDAMTALSTSHRILFEKEGMVVIDLESPR